MHSADPSPLVRVYDDLRARDPSLHVELGMSTGPGWVAGADLRDAGALGADFSRAALPGASLHGADLSGALLGHVDARGADFGEAALRGANLANSRFDRASFREAALEGAILTGATFEGADFHDAELNHAILAGADLSHARGLEQDQLDEACADGRTRLPPGLTAKTCAARVMARAWPLPPAPPPPPVPPAKPRYLVAEGQ